MTRGEEIIKEAELCASANTQIIGDWGEHYLGFIHGAQWADAHPVHYDGKAMLYVNNRSHENGYKEAVDKACEWLIRELCYTARENNFFNNKTATDEFVESFKKAMKGG